MRIRWNEQPRASILLMGSRFPSPGSVATVHSIYDSALNFRLRTTDQIFTIVSREELFHPHCAVADTLSFCTESAIENGMPVFLETKGLYFDCGLWVSFLGAKRVHSSEETVSGKTGTLKDDLLYRAQLLDKEQDRRNTMIRWSMLINGETQDLPAAYFVHNAVLLGNACKDNNADAACKAAVQLIGFGQGLTPSADDFLCGFLLALRMETPCTRFSEDFSNQLHQFLCTHHLCTTDISRQFLLTACEGAFSFALVALAKSCAKDDRHFLFALDRLCLIGHSSGLDAATGLLFGLLIKEEKEEL